jgi:hypothetical protein
MSDKRRRGGRNDRSVVYEDERFRDRPQPAQSKSAQNNAVIRLSGLRYFFYKRSILRRQLIVSVLCIYYYYYYYIPLNLVPSTSQITAIETYGRVKDTR